MKNFDSIEEALNVDTEVVENDKIEPRKNQLKKSDQNDSEKDYEYAEKHRDIIARFGRFPHRNMILGRKSTNEEMEFLKQPGSAF